MKAAALLCVLAGLFTAPAGAGTINTFVLSNEGGGLVNQLITAGYGDLSMYDALVQMQNDANPEILQALPDAFLSTLNNHPPGSPIFTTTMTQISGETVAIGADGTVQIVNVLGATFYNQPGTATITSNIGNGADVYVPHALFTYSTSVQPLTSWQSGGNTYDVFAVGWTAGTSATPEPSSLALILTGALGLAVWRKYRRQA